MTINELLYDHQKALLRYQHSSPAEEREVHWADAVIAASQLMEWREANGVQPHGLPEGTTPLGNTTMMHSGSIAAQPRGRLNEWENEGGALARRGVPRPSSDFIVMSAGQFFVGQNQFDNLSVAVAYTRRY
ncbi:hypothetical protein [Sphingomicrobium clamense]|uniref:SCP domain-containing protein n=1 Tax=Sphingomicrobium clamense TaxID=2851013 RepID=A0ABS6V2K7_9SPHN|nr:hypothetical protein [Sphingomicrobium sp. B8]MBW0143789.1 hypothetical protein [Sphingomicrobium sp. B8]